MSDVELLSSTSSPMELALCGGFQEGRREIRQAYRKLLEKNAENMEQLDLEEVTRDMKEANKLVENVVMPREGTFDTALLKQCSEILKKKSDRLQTGPTFSPDLFAKRLVGFMKNINPEEVVLPGEDGTVTQLTAENWEKLNEDVAPCFKRCPGFTYLYGAFPPDEPVKKIVEKQKREKALPASQIGHVTMPKEISEINAETEEQRLANKIKVIREYLDLAYQQMDRKPVGYYEFLVDPTNFGKTVENMFYFTFLLKDGFARYHLNEGGDPLIIPLPPLAPGERHVAKESVITSITWDEWEEMSEVFNFNVGILGHVDSGKTSLAKILSTVASTAAFDKNPQSQERGITLDLGFSSFSVNTPQKLIDSDLSFSQFSRIQFTLVDCPGHASLIKTVIGGAQIIDLVLLVVDAQKGVQTQTAECLILAEITCPNHMIVALNKVDLLGEPPESQKYVEKISRKLRKTLETTSFRDAPIVPTSCLVSSGVQSLIDVILDRTYRPLRNEVNGPFLFSVDHCFGIKGQGTVMTGTVLSGTVKLNDQLEIPCVKEVKKVKSMQMFRQPVQRAVQGDRVALCVAQFDAHFLERGLVCGLGCPVAPIYAALVRPEMVRYYKQTLASKCKLHVTVGHETSLARCTFFTSLAGSLANCQLRSNNGQAPTADNSAVDKFLFDFSKDYKYLDKLREAEPIDETISLLARQAADTFCLLEFDQPVLCPAHCLCIASKLDVDQQANMKKREGLVERMVDAQTLIAVGLFKKQTNIDAFINFKVSLSTGETGRIEGHFGQNGKAKIGILNSGLQQDTIKILQQKADWKKKASAPKKEDANYESTAIIDKEASTKQLIKISLDFKRYIYACKKNMAQ